MTRDLVAVLEGKQQLFQDLNDYLGEYIISPNEDYIKLFSEGIVTLGKDIAYGLVLYIYTNSLEHGSASWVICEEPDSLYALKHPTVSILCSKDEIDTYNITVEKMNSLFPEGLQPHQISDFYHKIKDAA